MQCPRDKAPLVGVKLHELPVDQCPKCGGIWFDGGELEHLVSAHKFTSKNKGKEVVDIPTDAHYVILPSNLLTWVCPKDGATLERIAYAKDRGTVIEHCTACGGWWFDRDDVDRALALHVPEHTTERVAVALLREGIRLERERKEDAERLREIASAFSYIASPYGIFYFIAKLLQMYVMHKIEESNAPERNSN